MSAGFGVKAKLLTINGEKFWSFIFGLQDNGKSASPIYADPTSGTESNVYTGSSTSVGTWDPPGSPWTGSWAGTDASDPNVYTNAGDVEFYPLVAVAYDLAWNNYGASGLSSEYPSPSNAGETAQEFLDFATSSTEQGDIKSSSYYYAPLPSHILTDAQDAAAAVNAG